MTRLLGLRGRGWRLVPVRAGEGQARALSALTGPGLTLAAIWQRLASALAAAWL